MAQIIIDEGTAPSTPSSGKVSVYAKTDGQIYSKDDAGTETKLNNEIPITLGTPVASTSGTSIDFTGIPSGTKRISINFNGVSTNGTSLFLVQIGDAGGVEATGYLSTCQQGSTATGSTAGFVVRQAQPAAGSYSGTIVLSKENSTNFSWVSFGIISRVDSAYDTGVSSGGKSLSAELDRVRITTVGGADTFDAGEINISYE